MRSTIHVPLLLLALICSAAFGSDKIPKFGDAGCSECTEAGHFCGIDGICHEFSCQNYYQYADPLLTGYAGNTTFECFGYTKGEQEFAHGVIFGCKPLFPFVLVTPGKQVTEPFNRRCLAEREGGYKFECYEFMPSETATDFAGFEREAESSFPDCGEGITPMYFSIIASSNHYAGVEGLQGNPIVAGGGDADGDTYWQTNEAQAFNREIAMRSMYANVVGGPSPPVNVESIQAGSLGGNNPLKNPRNDDHGGPDSGAVVSWSRRTDIVGLGFGLLLHWLWL
jgi:hypothetical protein